MTNVEPVSASASSPTNPKFIIRQYQDEDHGQVLDIFVEGVNEYPEHQNDPLLDAFIQQCRESDLSDINGTYIAPGGNFWVATLEKEPETVVGMIGLEAKQDGEAELRRMSVRRSHQRCGIGRLLISTLEQWAVANGYHTVWLTTGGIMTKARVFYEATGYKQVSTFQIDDKFTAIKFEKALVAAPSMREV